ncbi:MAG: glutamate synthase subunit beta [Myxococcales bacterium]|nr:glutamate synthase subunit beta [Myxococcales bacterium]TDJ01069.1 MAG: glutamate synthase subunit beta [Deltaproteobacteria bacterium]
MGKITGFMEHERKTPPKRSVEERVQDYLEVYRNPSEEDTRAQGARCMDCGIPFCQEGCPLGNIIPDWNDLVYRGKWEDALARLHRTNNFPEFTGRICPAPCESACVLGINDDPVTIEFIEKTIAERGFAEGWVVPRPPARRSGKRVAVIGSGPAGLAGAAQLNQAGHTVTVFEKKDRLGGLLRYGIPDFKLEKWVIDRRLEILQAEGIEFRTGVHVGVTVSARELRDEFDALLLASGAEAPRDLPVPGRELTGVHFAMDFLEQQNRRGVGETVDEASSILATGKNVVVLGGGDTGSDCIGTSHRQGVKHLYNFELLEKPPETRSEETPWPLHPLPSQILRSSTSHEEGGDRDWGVSTTRLSGSHGRLEKLHTVRVRFGEPDPASGRRKLEEVPGSESTLDVDVVLLAMGFLGPVREGMLEELEVEFSQRGNVATQGYASSIPGVFAAGDMRRGQSLVVWAIDEGRQAAAEIDRYLR